MDKMLIRKDVYEELLEKGFGKKDYSKLTKKVITDKNGHRRTVFVRNGEQPADVKQPKAQEGLSDEKRAKYEEMLEKVKAGSDENALIVRGKTLNKEDAIKHLEGKLGIKSNKSSVKKQLDSDEITSPLGGKITVEYAKEKVADNRDYIRELKKKKGNLRKIKALEDYNNKILSQLSKENVDELDELNKRVETYYSQSEKKSDTKDSVNGIDINDSESIKNAAMNLDMTVMESPDGEMSFLTPESDELTEKEFVQKYLLKNTEFSSAVEKQLKKEGFVKKGDSWVREKDGRKEELKVESVSNPYLQNGDYTSVTLFVNGHKRGLPFGYIDQGQNFNKLMNFIREQRKLFQPK